MEDSKIEAVEKAAVSSLTENDENDSEISFADLGLDETILAAIEKKVLKLLLRSRFWQFLAF